MDGNDVEGNAGNLDPSSSDSDNELWYSESSSDSDEEYYYRRCLSVDKTNVLDDYWIQNIETPIKCNGKKCNDKKIKGLWYICDLGKKDYCSKCSALNELETQNIFNPNDPKFQDSELMRAIRLKDKNLAFDILEDKDMMENTNIDKIHNLIG